MEEKIYTVYSHISPSNKMYIGITKNNPLRRWKNGHGYRVENQPSFANAIKKYGWDNFQHNIIAENLTKVEAKQMEQDLIKKYNTTNPDYGYNMTTGGDNTSVKWARPVDQYDLNGIYITTYPSAAEAERTLKHREDNGSILKAAKGIYVHAYGYGWAFSEDFPDKTQFAQYFLPRYQQSQFNIKDKNNVSINCYDKDYNLLYTFASMRDAEKKLGINHSTICRNCGNNHLVKKLYYFEKV